MAGGWRGGAGRWRGGGEAAGALRGAGYPLRSPSAEASRLASDPFIPARPSPSARVDAIRSPAWHVSAETFDGSSVSAETRHGYSTVRAPTAPDGRAGARERVAAPRRVAAAFPRSCLSPSLPLISRASSESAMELARSRCEPGSARPARRGEGGRETGICGRFLAHPSASCADRGPVCWEPLGPLWPHHTSGRAKGIASSAETSPTDRDPVEQPASDRTRAHGVPR